MTEDRRLIEDYIPIQAISAEASREKSVRKGHISTLHLWWARRPLVACRAAVYGALIPASQFVPENAPENKQKSLGRANAAQFVERLCKYPGASQTIAEAQKHILEAHAKRLSQETGKPVTMEDILEGRAPRPKVLDMFAGGGAIPLEALRLGCEAYALDLNPVAHIIELCTLVYPQKYGKPDANVRGMTGPKNARGEKTWGGLAEEVRYWGNWVLDKVKAEIGDLYPMIPDNEPRSESKPKKKAKKQPKERQATFEGMGMEEEPPCNFLTPVAYLWTRTVRCKNPSCGAIVPLVKQTWLCKKKDRYVALRIVAPPGEKRARFEVVEAKIEKELGFDPAAGSKGGNATCPFCGTVADSTYVKAEGCAQRIGQQMMAVVCTRKGRQGKVYLAADDVAGCVPDDAAIRKRIAELCQRTGLTVPEETIVNDAKNANFCVLYGLTDFGKLFTPRQMLCLLRFVVKVREMEKDMERQGYGEERNDIISYLGMYINRSSDHWSSLCTWNPSGEKLQHTYVRQALPMVWDFAEANPFGRSVGDWMAIVLNAENGISTTASAWPLVAHVVRGSATSLPWADNIFDAVITDPPYYDNVPYANISDFFYVWLKRTIGHLYPEHFASEATPKKNEAVADAMRHEGSKQKARRAYESMMAQAFAEAHRVLKPGGQMVVVYAHKTTLGWSTLVDALRQAGFTVTEAWPFDTEMKSRLRGMDSAALASSIFLVARKRTETQVGAYEEVQPALEEIVRERVESLLDMGITGADLVIAAVGAGLRAFTHFARVEYANGEEMAAEKFLAEVEGLVLEVVLEKIFGVSRSGIATVDAPTRFYVLWRFTYKAAELDAGEAIVFTYGQHVELDGQKSLSAGTHALIVKNKGKYRLRDFTERGGWDKLGMPDENKSPAPLVDTLHRILWLIENEPRSLTDFLLEVLPDRERLRLVAQALAGAGLSGKSREEQESALATTTDEQSALRKLMANWRSLVEEPLAKEQNRKLLS